MTVSQPGGWAIKIAVFAILNDQKWGDPPYFQKSTEVNSLFINRVSHLTRALFLTSTPVPLTVWKRIPYSQKSSKI
jgi:hypothetical protein